MIRTLRETTFWRKTSLLAVGATVAILLLVGCSSDADERPTPTTTSQPAPTVQAAPSPTVTAMEGDTEVISDKDKDSAAEGRRAEENGEETVVPDLLVDEAAAAIAAYATARDSALVQGREVARSVIAGEVIALYQRFTPNFKSMLPEEMLRDAFDELTKNLVRFEVQEIGAAFAGNLKGNEISGAVGDVAEFNLQRDSAGDSDETLDQIAGHWEGTVDTGVTKDRIVVDFTDDGAGLSGTITIPELGVVPLSSISYHSSLMIGERVAESAAPGIYSAEHAWGDGSLIMGFSLDSDGMVQNLEVVPSLQLPADPAAGYRTRAKMRLPFSGLWVAAAAGPHQLTNHHVISRQERHAIDLFIWKHGASHHSSGSLNEHYWAWGEPVLAPADGTVTALRDGLPDTAIGGTNVNEPAGNHVVLDLGNSEYLLIAHLQNGSVKVQVGDTVVAGQVLGLTGSSGRSTEPHIHIHLQDGPDIYSLEAIGLPLSFSDYESNGELVSLGTLTRGQLVRPIVP